MKTKNNETATRMLERDAQLRSKFEERKAHMAANNERIKTPDGRKTPKRCDSVRLVMDDGKRHTAYICDAKQQPNDWDTDYPSITLTCRLVWGRCDAADFTLAIDTGLLSARTAKLRPWHISEISQPKWTVVFSDGSIIDMKYCRLTPITDMQAIRDNANVQRIIAAHFSGGGNMAVKTNRQAVTQFSAAKACGVSERTIRDWDKNKSTPKDYPGRKNPTVFIKWADSYKQTQSAKKELRNAARVPDMDVYTSKDQCQKWDEGQRNDDDFQSEMRRYGKGGKRKSDY